MALFVSSISAIGASHGVFAIERPPPSVIVATGTGGCAIVGAFPWGPVQSEYVTSSKADFFQTFTPLGMDRSGSGYLKVVSGSYPELSVVRVLGTSSVAATATVVKSGPTSMLTLTAKHNGTAGNSLVATIAAASDGNSNHFNLSVTVSNSEGSTTDLVQNLNYSGVGDDSVPDLTAALLLGSITKLASGQPVVGTYNFSGGSNGNAIVSGDYIGTLGSGDKGLALLEGDPNIRHEFFDDMGNSLRAACNSGMVAHVNSLLDRTGYITGNSAQTAAQAQADANSYESTNIVYVDPWVKVFDDSGTKQLVPGDFLAVSCGSNASPSTAFSWRDDTLRKFLASVVELEALRGTQKAANTQQGISTLIKFPKGGFAFEAAVVTEAPANPAKANWTRTQMGIYIAKSVQDSLQSSVDAPNVPLNQNDIVNAIQTFMQDLKRNASVDPNGSPFVLDFSIAPTSASNTQASLDAGNFIVALNVKLASSLARIILSIQYGESVTITAS